MAKKNSAGKLRGRVQIGVDAEGKPINKYVCATNARELEEMKEEVRRHYIDGEPTRDDMMFCAYAEEWYRLKKEPFISDSTKASYHSCFTKHVLPTFGLRCCAGYLIKRRQQSIAKKRFTRVAPYMTN